MKNIKLFIWDFDGTLLDTYPMITGCLRRALLDFGRDVSQTEILEKMMVNIPYAINYYSELYQLPNLQERYKFYEADEKNAPVKIFPQVKEVLKRINEIVTSANPHFVVKPAPDVIFYLMEKYGGTPEDTVMIGDRVCDLESGYNAQCRTCHLLTPDVPQYPPCDWRISNFEEMLELLR